MVKQTVDERIRQRRHQMIFHSVAYYKYGISFISDEQFDKWANELRKLQKAYPKASKRVVYAKEFKGWDGTTGFHLVDVDLPKFRSKIYHQIQYMKKVSPQDVTAEMDKYVADIQRGLKAERRRSRRKPKTPLPLDPHQVIKDEIQKFLAWLEHY